MMRSEILHKPTMCPSVLSSCKESLLHGISAAIRDWHARQSSKDYYKAMAKIFLKAVLLKVIKIIIPLFQKSQRIEIKRQTLSFQGTFTDGS